MLKRLFIPAALLVNSACSETDISQQTAETESSSVYALVQDIRSGKIETAFDGKIPNCSHSHTLEEVLSDSDIVIFGDGLHYSDTIRFQMANLISEKSPKAYITEVMTAEEKKELEDRLQNQDLRALTALYTPPFAAIKAAYLNENTTLVPGEIHDSNRKVSDLLESERLNQKFLTAETFDDKLIYYSDMMQVLSDRYEETDPEFAKAFYAEAQRDGERPVFGMVGAAHVFKIRQEISKLIRQDHSGIKVSAIHLFPVNAVAYDQLKDFGVFKTEDVFVMPVYDPEPLTAYPLESFLEFMDSQANSDPNIFIASGGARGMDGIGFGSEEYRTEPLLDQCN